MQLLRASIAAAVLSACVAPDDADLAETDQGLDLTSSMMFRVPGTTGDELDVTMASGAHGFAIRRDGELAVVVPVSARDSAHIAVLDRNGNTLGSTTAALATSSTGWLRSLATGSITVTASNFNVRVSRQDGLHYGVAERLHAEFLDLRGASIPVTDIQWSLLVPSNIATLQPDLSFPLDRDIVQLIDQPVPMQVCTKAMQVCWGLTLAQQNRAGVFRRTGTVQTAVDLGAVANGDHTIALRFMPQYPRSYTGPLFSNEMPSVWRYEASLEASGADFADEVSVRLTIDNVDTLYPVSWFEPYAGKTAWPTNVAPPIVPARWHTLAITRTSNVMRVYVDGQEVMPVNGGARPTVPTTLTIPSVATYLGGQRLASMTPLEQFYGVIDDFATFSVAKSATEIQAMLAPSRLSPSEPGLVELENFDSKTTATFTGASASSDVSNLRDYQLDQVVLPLPYQVATAHLPFLAPEVWQVQQGNDGDYSHRGMAAFSWDFIYVPDSAVAAAAAGQPTSWWGDCTLGGNRRILSAVDMTITNVGARPTIGQGYVAGVTSTSPTAAPELEWTEHFLDGSQRPIVGATVTPDTVLAQVDPSPCHNHISFDTSVLNWADMTIPMAFSDYDVSRDYGRTWQHVDLGMPQVGEWVHRSGPPTQAIDPKCAAATTKLQHIQLGCG